MERKELLLFIKRAQKRIFLCDLVWIFMWYLGAGLGIGILMNVISLFVPVYGAQRMALGAVLLVMTLGFFYGISRFPGKKQAARMVDEKGLSERVFTALEQLEEDSAISRLQRRDTLEHLQGFSLKEKFPIRKDMTAYLMLLGLLGAFTATALLPSEARQEALRQHELKEEIKAETQKAEELKRLLDTEKGIQELLKAGGKEELISQLDQSIKELSRAESQQELLKAEKRLAKKVSKALEGAADQKLSGKALSLLKNYMPDLQKKQLELAKNSSIGQEAQTGSENGQNSRQNGSQNGSGSRNGQGTGTGTGYNYGSNQGVEKTDRSNRSEPEKVTIPGRKAGEDDNLTGTGEKGSSSYEEGSQSEGFRGEEVDYSSVLGKYSQAAYDRLNEGRIPEGMENIVKNYFDGLNE